PVINLDDFAAVHDRVLVARQEIGPVPPVPFEERARQRLEVTLQEEPEIVTQRGAGNLLLDYIGQERDKFLTIGWAERRDYVFSGLGIVRERAEQLETRLRADSERIATVLREKYGVPIQPEDVTLRLLLDQQLRPFVESDPDLGYALNEGTIQLRFKVEGVNTFGSLEQRFSVEFNGRRE